MNLITKHLSSVTFVAAFGFSAIGVAPATAQVAVAVPQAALGATADSCTSATACDAAVQALVDQLVAANPGVDVALILASVVSAIAASYNAGTFPDVAAELALASTAGIASAGGFTAIAASATAAATTVAAGDTIDLEAVAESSGSPA